MEQLCFPLTEILPNHFQKTNLTQLRLLVKVAKYLLDLFCYTILPWVGKSKHRSKRSLIYLQITRITISNEIRKITKGVVTSTNWQKSRVSQVSLSVGSWTPCSPRSGNRKSEKILYSFPFFWKTRIEKNLFI